MTTMNSIVESPVDDLTAMTAEKLKTSKSAILLFGTFTEAVTELLRIFYKPQSLLVGAGHVTPEIEIAADRAEIELVEALAASPFSSDVEGILPAIRSPHDLIYVANPNRVTGANYTIADLERLARAVPHGALIIDEHYYDYFGISGFPLLDILTNLVIVRSFTTGDGPNSSDAGFILGNPDTMKIIKDSSRIKSLPSSTGRTILSTLVNDEILATQLRELHEEALRVASTLTRLGVQCRITPADFLLLRVASPKNVGDFLVRYNSPVDNLDGYPQLKSYLRYTVQSVNGNERLLEAFKKMPEEYYQMRTADGRAVTINRPANIARAGNKRFRQKSGSRPGTLARQPTRS